MLKKHSSHSVRSLKLCRECFLIEENMKLLRYFTKSEWFIWLFSFAAILSVYLLLGGEWLSCGASFLGVTSILLNAKGNPLGQLLMVIFSLAYGVISFGFGYYGEVLTYLGMTAPMAVLALVAWLRHPYKGNRSEVAVNRVKKGKMVFAFLLSAAVAVLFYFPLKSFHTANLIPSTLSVFTSFLAVYLTFRRSEWCSLAYAANDVVLIVLWSLASAKDLSYLSVTVCFCMFFISDCYGFISWRKMRRRQGSA